MLRAPLCGAAFAATIAAVLTSVSAQEPGARGASSGGTPPADRITMRSRLLRLLLIGVLTAAAGGCASLQALRKVVLPPRFEQAGPPPQVRLVGPRADMPAGGAAVRISLRVTNPNPFGVTLSTLRTTLILEDMQAATGDFPLGLPLQAGQTSEVPLDLSVSFADLPALGRVFRNAIAGRQLPYRLDGTIGIDAGALGQPTFGPMTLVSGELRVPGAIGQ